ncbi:kinase-like domain-containing protein [Mycena polygramma]|nr:kinase-like domain-containing protein [Mycena polygramma]
MQRHLLILSHLTQSRRKPDGTRTAMRSNGPQSHVTQVCDSYLAIYIPTNVLQAVDFLHSNGIAHCDIYYANLLVQRPPQRPYQWYLMDFGSAVSYDPADPLATRPLIDGTHRTARRDCPEYSSGGSFDPFAFDIYCWGWLMARLCEDVKLDFPIVQQLTKEMTHLEPQLRPCSKEVLNRVTRAVSDLRALLRDGQLSEEVLGRWPQGCGDSSSSSNAFTV